MRRQRTHLIDQLRDLDRIIDRSFNPYWGLLFKAHNERSLFGSQVQRYADLYTSTICNFLAYSPRQYFRAPLATMPHEL